MEHITMKELATDLRPHEKCLKYGAAILADEELLSIILRTGTADRRVNEIARDIITRCECYGGLAYLERLGYKTLLGIKGIGEVKAVQLLCIFELARRVAERQKSTVLKRVESPQEVAALFMDKLRGLEVEETWALYLDGKNAILKNICLTKGTANASLISTREIFKEAVRIGAVGLMLVHNHPSGDPEPSSNDIEVTKKVKLAGSLMDVELIDHVIIGDLKFVSMRQCGVI